MAGERATVDDILLTDSYCIQKYEAATNKIHVNCFLQVACGRLNRAGGSSRFHDLTWILLTFSVKAMLASSELRTFSNLEVK